MRGSRWSWRWSLLESLQPDHYARNWQNPKAQELRPVSSLALKELQARGATEASRESSEGFSIACAQAFFWQGGAVFETKRALFEMFLTCAVCVPFQ